MSMARAQGKRALRGEERRVEERYLCKSYDSYESMRLPDKLLKCILDKGTNQQPSRTEKKGIVPLVEGNNVILHSPSSSERRKTMCYGVLGRLDYDDPNCQVLILAPDKESAKMIKILLLDLGKSNSVKVDGCTGSGYGKKTNFQVFVDTPSNVSAVSKRDWHPFGNVNFFVLEGAEELIRSSSSEIFDILDKLVCQSQAAIFFKYYDNENSLEYLRFAREIMNEKTTYLISAGEGETFEKVKIGDGMLTRGNAVHYHVDVGWAWDDQTKLVMQFFNNSVQISNDSYRRKSIVYIDSKSYPTLSEVFEEMPVSFITEESDNIKESKKNFSEGSTLMLITTRGVRELVEDNVLIIFYDLPTRPDVYMQRIGYEKQNVVVINFIRTSNDMDFYKIQDYYNFVIGPIPLFLRRIYFENHQDSCQNHQDSCQSDPCQNHQDSCQNHQDSCQSDQDSNDMIIFDSTDMIIFGSNDNNIFDE